MPIDFKEVTGAGDVNSRVHKATFVAGGDTQTNVLEWPGYADKTISIGGTTLNGKILTAYAVDSSGNVLDELTDLHGNSVVFNAIGKKFTILENTNGIKLVLTPNSTGVDFVAEVVSGR